MKMATKILINTSTISLTHSCYRKLSTVTTACFSTRLVPHPPDLIGWVRQEGGFVHRALKIANGDSTGLGLIASSEIQSGSELIVLPNNLPLCFASLDADQNHSDGTLIQLACPVPEELWAMRLGLKLLQERANVGSFWWSYISNLPEAFNLPIFFSGEDIKNLQYAPLIYQINKRCRFLLDFEKEVKSVLHNVGPQSHPFGGQDVNASSLGWAMSAVSSRAFRLHGDKNSDAENGNMPMLLPLIDMCNHSFNPNARIVQENDVGHPKMLVKVLAETQIDRDTPVKLNYGNLSNDLLLLDYGFVIPANPYDYIELKFDGVLLEAASLAAGVQSANFLTPATWQHQILLQLNLQGADADLKVTVGGPEMVDGRLLAALRVLLASDMETVHKYDLNTLKSLSVEAPLGLSNEISTLRTIIALCVIAHEHFPTKIMEDESLLKGDLSTSKKLAIQFRIGKKSLIINVMRDLTRRVKMLSKEKSVGAI